MQKKPSPPQPRPNTPRTRRQCLQAASAGGALGLWAALGALHPRLALAARSSPATAWLAASWADARSGQHHAGLLALRAGALHVRQQLPLPTRAHALQPLPGGALLVVARRPGDWLLRWHPGQTRPPQWVWAEADRAFNGHLIPSADGARLFSTETDQASGQGLIGVRDARNLQLLAEWPSHGLDPHALLLLPDGSLLVANGGIPTQPETGRAKRALARMDASLVRLHPQTGALLGQWRLPDARLSLRHLAAQSAHIGIALQAEHDHPAQRAAAPVLATFDGQQLRTHAAPESVALAGYGGDIAAQDGQWWVSCPRANAVACFAADGQWRGLLPLPKACALTTTADALWAGGQQQAARHSAHTRQTHAAPHLQLDNHWAPWPGPGQA